MTDIEGAMITVAGFLARTQQLLDRRQASPGPHEWEEVERLLAEIDTALNLLDEAASDETSDEQAK
jgi:hypothetical protein